MNNLVCWKCGAGLESVVLPFRRLEVCPECDVELHACRMCAHYEPRVTDQCTEELAEEVRDKQRANFCDYFKPQPGAYVATRDAAKAEASRAELDSLFGADTSDGDGEEGDSTRDALQQLFGDK